MRFTVLGKSPAWEDAGGACSGYLLQEGDYAAMIDCGNGAFSKLRERIDYREVDEVVISHLHADHFLDLVPFAYALTLTHRSGPQPPRPRLWLPPGARGGLRRLVSVWGDPGLIEAAFEVGEYERAGALELGPVAARLHPVPHFTLTHAVELTSPARGRLVYGADCRSCEELVVAAADADVLIAEATLPEPEPDRAPVTSRGHMSAGEAGELAGRARVGRLVLTHISDQLDLEASRAAAAAAFGGPVELARTGSSWEL